MQNPSVIRTRSRQRTIAPAREIPWSFMLLVIVCACVVAAGFFFAARQHFTSIDYGIKNSKLRKQLEDLEAEKRRLVLAREVALSPMSVQKAAKSLGLRKPSEEFVAVQASKKAPVMTDDAETIKSVKAVVKKNETPGVVTTVLTAPVQPKSDGEVRRRVVDTHKEKKEKSEVAALLKFK